MVIYTQLDGRINAKMRESGLKCIKSHPEVPKVWIAIPFPWNIWTYEYMNGQDWPSGTNTIFSNLFVINIYNSIVWGH